MLSHRPQVGVGYGPNLPISGRVATWSSAPLKSVAVVVNVATDKVDLDWRPRGSSDAVFEAQPSDPFWHGLAKVSEQAVLGVRYSRIGGVVVPGEWSACRDR